MIQIPRWKIILILIVCALGILYSLPNVMGKGAREWTKTHLPGIVPHKTVNLGLDLRGGAHLLLEVQLGRIIEDRLDDLLDSIRPELRKQKIGYKRLKVHGNVVSITLRDVADRDEVKKLVHKLDRELILSDVGDDGISAEFSEAAIKEIKDLTINQSIEIVRRRIDETGTREPAIQRQGEDRILVQLPGLEDPSEIKALLGTTAKLTFHLVDRSASDTGGMLTLPMAENPGETMSIARRAILTGDMLVNAQYSPDQNGQAAVSFKFNALGAKRFCDISRANVNRLFAIVLDKEIISAPVIREPICGGQGQISGNFSVQEASHLGLLLRAGALPAPLEVLEERTVGPSLGADSVEAGKIASLIGLAGVLIFMLLTYGLFGVFANIALMVNVALIFALLSSLQATLTLPGIAGIVLTIGMAVDANVLIFERIKEEIGTGKSALAAVDAGFGRAMSTIIDSNLTTLIAAIILYSFGTGPIKGFSVTLAVGIMTSFFSAIMITRLLVVVWIKKKKPSVLPI